MTNLNINYLTIIVVQYKQKVIQLRMQSDYQDNQDFHDDYLYKLKSANNRIKMTFLSSNLKTKLVYDL